MHVTTRLYHGRCLFIEPSGLDKLRNLIFARLIGIRFPDLVQRYELLRAFDDSLYVDITFSEPVNQLLYPCLHALSASGVAERLERVVHAGCVHLRADRLQDDCEEHCGNSDDMRCVQKGQIGKIVVVDD